MRSDPVSSVRRIEGFIERSAGVAGVVAIRKAAPYVVGRAASPPEIDLALKLSLPPGYGGSGLPRPELNVKVCLGDKSAKMAGRNYVAPDLL